MTFLRQVIAIPLICYFAMLLDFSLYNLFGCWADPHLLLLVVIFFNLYSGVRFSLWAAFWAGIFKDCFSTMPFGTHIFTYVACVYFSTLIRRYCYERGNDWSKLFLVFSVVTFRVLLLGLLQQMAYDEISWQDVFSGVWLPGIIVSMFLAVSVFTRLMILARALRF